MDCCLGDKLAVDSKFQAPTASKQAFLAKVAQLIQCIEEFGDRAARLHEEQDRKEDVIF